HAGPCLSDEEMQAVISTAHALGRKTTIHARYPNTVVAAVKAGIDWLIHASYMRKEDIGVVRDARTPTCPTLTCTAKTAEWARADILVVDGDPLADIGILADPKKIATILHDGEEVDRSHPIPERRRMAHERGFNVSVLRLGRTEAHRRKSKS